MNLPTEGNVLPIVTVGVANSSATGFHEKLFFVI
jgi:hypothetical protein